MSIFINWLKWKIAGKELEELHRWRCKTDEYWRWLAEFYPIALTLENLREEVAGRPLNICYPPGDARPWSADNLRYQLRKHDEIAKLAARVGAAAQSQEGGK